jgi:hypothetical protein
MPFPSDVDIEQFFDEAARLGSGVVVTTDWHSMRSFERVTELSKLARSRGLKLHLYLDPIGLEGLADYPLRSGVHARQQLGRSGGAPEI